MADEGCDIERVQPCSHLLVEVIKGRSIAAGGDRETGFGVYGAPGPRLCAFTSVQLRPDRHFRLLAAR
jgi:hypothetical protein